MYVELRTVSRKTPTDGRLEVSRRAAHPMLTRRAAFALEVNGARGRVTASALPCTCARAGGEHVHYFLESELLRLLPDESEVSVEVREQEAVVVVASR